MVSVLRRIWRQGSAPDGLGQHAGRPRRAAAPRTCSWRRGVLFGRGRDHACRMWRVAERDERELLGGWVEVWGQQRDNPSSCVYGARGGVEVKRGGSATLEGSGRCPQHEDEGEWRVYAIPTSPAELGSDEVGGPSGGRRSG